MNLYILDTDHLSLQQRGYEPLRSRIDSTPPESIAITVISLEELIRGRLAQIREARAESEFIRAYRWLVESSQWLGRFQILDYDESGSRIFTSLRRQKIRIGTQDLRIAAITLSVGGILTTRNSVDFGKVPGLTIQDWTV